MRLLLDTHVLLWALRDPDRLSGTARALIEDRHVELLVSTVSAFEIATKSRLGKLPGVELLIQDYAGFLERLDAHGLPLRDSHALWAGSASWEHRDPFDRLLAAQSALESAPLLTSDPAFASLPGAMTIW